MRNVVTKTINICHYLCAIVSRYLPNMEQNVVSKSTIASLLIEQFSLLMALFLEESCFIHNFSSKSI